VVAPAARNIAARVATTTNARFIWTSTPLRKFLLDPLREELIRSAGVVARHPAPLVYVLFNGACSDPIASPAWRRPLQSESSSVCRKPVNWFSSARRFVQEANTPPESLEHLESFQGEHHSLPPEGSRSRPRIALGNSNCQWPLSYPAIGPGTSSNRLVSLVRSPTKRSMTDAGKRRWPPRVAR